MRPRASAHAAAVNDATLRVPSVRSRQSRSAKLPKICRKRHPTCSQTFRGSEWSRRKWPYAMPYDEPATALRKGLNLRGNQISGASPIDATCSRSCICAMAWRFHTG